MNRSAAVRTGLSLARLVFPHPHRVSYDMPFTLACARFSRRLFYRFTFYIDASLNSLTYVRNTQENGKNKQQDEIERRR